MLDWLVIGGGIHGTYLSLALTLGGRVARDRLRVLDPHEAPLARWNACTENVGMEFLRSPFVHHLDPQPFGLRAFAPSKGRGKRAFLGRYLRPSLSLFRAHTESMITKHGLASMRLHGEATSIAPIPFGLRVETERGPLDARRVLLAIGMSDQPAIPDWARRVREEGGRVHHVFEPGFSRVQMAPFRHVVVVGGGISAAQTALALAKREEGTVTLLSRHPARVHAFDSDPGWMGPKNLDHFARVSDHDVRRKLIRQARHRGSMPDDVASALRRAVNERRLSLRIAGVSSATLVDGNPEMSLDDGGAPLVADAVVLATGFESRRPGGEWLARAVEELGLRCASCGYPIVDRGLRWHPGLFVTGPLAELEIGPPARNILGARLAAERLVQVA